MGRAYVTFLWNHGFRHYKPEHVNLLASACHYFDPMARFVCVSEMEEGFSPLVQVVPLPQSAKRLGSIPAPQGGRFPSSYRRLWCFSEEAKVLGNRIMLLDIDCMMLKDPASLCMTEGDFVGWRPSKVWGKENRIGGGTWMLTTGTKTKVWERFIENPSTLIRETSEMGWNGSDQAILSRFLKDEVLWPRHCGIYGVQEGVFQWERPPKDAIIVHFNGDDKPWNQGKMWMQAYCHFFST